MLGVRVDGRYQIIKLLGGGAFGQTFLARDTKRPGQPYCVVKQLHYVSQNPKALSHARRLFKQEAEILEKLGHHDQIPTLLADIDENQDFYLVEQFVPGHPLTSELVPARPWGEEETIALLADVLQVLVFVHGQNVIHRDIKPANLMRRQADGKVVLIDFGAVKELGTQIAHSQLAPGQSAPTIAIGTPGYMPIEQFNGQPQFNSDLYALGIVAIQALLGLSADELSGLQTGHPPGQVVWRDRRSVSLPLANILDRMVQVDYRDRYPSANAVLVDLKRLGHSTLLPVGAIAPTISPSVYGSLGASVPTQAGGVIPGESQGLFSAEPSSSSPVPVEATATGTEPVTAGLPVGAAAPTRPRQIQSPSRGKKLMMLTLTGMLLFGGVAAVGFTQRNGVADFFYQQGRERSRVGDLKGALDNYSLAIQINPAHANAYARRCGSRLRLEDNTGALADCNQALQLDPNNAVAYLNIGNLRAEERDTEAANQAFTRSIELSSQAIQLDPDAPDPYFYRGAARFRLGDYQGAIADATRTIAIDADYGDAYVTRCQARGLLGEHEQAAADCQQAVMINPNHYVAYTSLCNNLSNAGQYDAAIDACTRALQINPNDPHAYNNRGVVWFRKGDYAAAIADYQQAIQRDPKDATAYHNLGEALALQGDRPGAIDSFSQAIAISPTFAAAYYSRGIRRVETGAIEAGIADLQQAADLYTQQGRSDGAEDALFQIRRIQEQLTSGDRDGEPEAEPETGAGANPTDAAAIEEPPIEPSVPTDPVSPSLPPGGNSPNSGRNPGTVPTVNPGRSAPQVEEPPLALPRARQPQPLPIQPAPYSEEPPQAPVYAPDPYTPDPYRPDPYVEEPPQPYSAPYDSGLNAPEAPFPTAPSLEPSLQLPQGRLPTPIAPLISPDAP